MLGGGAGTDRCGQVLDVLSQRRHLKRMSPQQSIARKGPRRSAQGSQHNTCITRQQQEVETPTEPDLSVELSQAGVDLLARCRQQRVAGVVPQDGERPQRVGERLLVEILHSIGTENKAALLYAGL